MSNRAKGIQLKHGVSSLEIVKSLVAHETFQPTFAFFNFLNNNCVYCYRLLIT